MPLVLIFVSAKVSLMFVMTTNQIQIRLVPANLVSLGARLELLGRTPRGTDKGLEPFETQYDGALLISLHVYLRFLFPAKGPRMQTGPGSCRFPHLLPYSTPTTTRLWWAANWWGFGP